MNFFMFLKLVTKRHFSRTVVNSWRQRVVHPCHHAAPDCWRPTCSNRSSGIFNSSY